MTDEKYLDLDGELAAIKQLLPDHLVLFREVHPDHRNEIFPKPWYASIQHYTTKGGWGKGHVGHGNAPAEALHAAYAAAKNHPA